MKYKLYLPDQQLWYVGMGRFHVEEKYALIATSLAQARRWMMAIKEYMPGTIEARPMED